MKAVTVTDTFLDHLFSGRMDAALGLIAADALFISTRPRPSDQNPLFGTFVGREGALRFFGRYGELLEPGEFVVDGRFGDDRMACLFGRLTHKVRATGRPFVSDWALVTQIEDGRLISYHFYEDTAALAEAMQPA